MITAGVINSNEEKLINDFNRHVNSLMMYDGLPYRIELDRMRIIFDDCVWEYILIQSSKDLNKIAGIQFQAIFSEVTDPELSQYIMTRFRFRSK